MTLAKYVLNKVNKNLLKQNVVINYAIIALNNQLKMIILMIVQYANKIIGFDNLHNKM